MEFYDPEIEQGAKSSHADAKTDKAVTDISSTVEKVYSNVEQNTKKGWSTFNNFFKTIQSSIPQNAELQKKMSETGKGLSENINKTRETLSSKLSTQLSGLNINNDNIDSLKQKSTQALKNVGSNTNKYLDQLDSHLEKVENTTLGYATQLTSFLQAKTGIKVGIAEKANSSSLGQKSIQQQANGSQSDILFNVPKGLASSRVEAQLHELQVSIEPYEQALNNSKKEIEKYILTEEEKQEADKQLSSEDSPLKKIQQELVPGKMGASFFLKCYFSSRKKIIQDEKKRKLLLEKTAEEDEDDFSWDDDSDDEEDKAETATKGNGEKKEE